MKILLVLKIACIVFVKNALMKVQSKISIFLQYRSGKKACPLCKAEYSTKREIREDKRLNKICKFNFNFSVNILKPFSKILNEDYNHIIENNAYESVKNYDSSKQIDSTNQTPTGLESN